MSSLTFRAAQYVSKLNVKEEEKHMTHTGMQVTFSSLTFSAPQYVLKLNAKKEEEHMSHTGMQVT